jgi:hypothetical protein
MRPRLNLGSGTAAATLASVHRPELPDAEVGMDAKLMTQALDHAG